MGVLKEREAWGRYKCGEGAVHAVGAARAVGGGGAGNVLGQQ